MNPKDQTPETPAPSQQHASTPTGGDPTQYPELLSQEAYTCPSSSSPPDTSPQGHTSLKGTTHEFSFASTSHEDDSEPDPLVHELSRLMAQTTTLDDFVEQLICKDAFDGLRSNHALMCTITEELEAIYKDNRTHHQLAADPNFSMNRLYPVPIAIALKTIAMSQG